MSTLEAIQARRQKFMHIKLHFKDFVEREALRLAQAIIIPEIVNRMMNAGFSRKIWQNTDAIKAELKNDKVIVFFRSEYFSDTGFDVAVAREYGTRRHMIRPRAKLALSWIMGGKRLFSKGHEVDGIESLKIIASSLEDKRNQLQDALNKSLIDWKDKILNT